MINSGKNVSIGANVKLGFPENIFLGENSYINGGFIIASKNANIRIGNFCMISHNVHIRTDSHNFSDNSTPMLHQGHSEKDINIGDNVWIGFGVQILSGIRIGSNSIVAAGSVVTKDVPPYSIVAGVPAKIIKMRKQ